MKRILIALIIVLSFSSCQKKEYIFVYSYNWTDGPDANWRSYNIVADEFLSDGAMEVFRQTEDNKVIVRGQTANGIVWSSYLTYLGSQER
jgi:hypothetical protein